MKLPCIHLVEIQALVTRNCRYEKKHFDLTWMHCQWAFKSIDAVIKCKASCKKIAVPSLSGSCIVMINSMGVKRLEFFSACVYEPRVFGWPCQEILLLSFKLRICYVQTPFHMGNGLFGENNNWTYNDQRACSLTAAHSCWIINASCFVGINLHGVTSEWWFQENM